MDAAENVVRGVDALSDSGVPSTDEIASELATVWEMLPLRLPHDGGALASEKPAREGAYCDLKSRSLRADPSPYRDPGLLTEGPAASRSPSSSPAAAKAFAVRGPSQSTGRFEGKS